MDQDVYLDIETSYSGQITIVGLFKPAHQQTIQLVAPDITSLGLLQVLDDVGVIKTYNGARFDLPVIKRQLGLDLSALFTHRDLMYLCWQHGYKGGLKAVEQQLHIVRPSQGIDGHQAMALWRRWWEFRDHQALASLLQYNQDDVELLAQVEERLLKLQEKRL